MTPAVRVLLVDDDEDSAVLLREVLGEVPGVPYQVEWAADYAQGLTALRSTAFDIALVDVHLGDANWIDLVAQALRAGHELPFVVISGTAREALADRDARQVGASDFLPKHSFNAISLDRCIRHALERHRLRQALREEQAALAGSDARLHAVVESSGNGLVVVDAAGAIQFSNGEAREAWAGALDQLLATLGTGAAGLIAEGSVTEMAVPGPDGAERFAEVRCAPVEWGGKRSRLLTVREITRRRALEQQLRQAQKMEEVGQLTGGIAHDLNNILSVVLAHADLLRAQVPAVYHDELSGIETAAARGADLIRRLMAFGRRQPLALRAVHPRVIFDEFASLARRVLPESIELTVEVDPDTPPLTGDPVALEQVLFNLATNARDAMPGGGRLRLEARRRRLPEDGLDGAVPVPSGEFVEIAVSDSGCGMDPGTRERMFEPFFTTKPAGHGTGLGMAMVWGLVEQHHGAIAVRSAPGAGTTIRLLFPEARSTPVPVAPAAPERLTGGSEVILFVEDQPELRRAACRILMRFGYTVLEAGNGEEALQVWEAYRHRIGLVISDVIMPRMGGPALLDALRAAGETVPFLFSSGYGEEVPGGGAGLRGAPMLTKPWSIARLIGTVRRILDEAGAVAAGPVDESGAG